MEAVELQKRLESSHSRERSNNRHFINESRHARDNSSDACIDRREPDTALLEPRNIRVAQESIGVRASEDDCVDVRVAVYAIN